MFTFIFDIVNDGTGRYFNFKMNMLTAPTDATREDVMKLALDIETNYNQDGSRRMHLTVLETVVNTVKP